PGERTQLKRANPSRGGDAKLEVSIGDSSATTESLEASNGPNLVTSQVSRQVGWLVCRARRCPRWVGSRRCLRHSSCGCRPGRDGNHLSGNHPDAALPGAMERRQLLLADGRRQL